MIQIINKMKKISGIFLLAACCFLFSANVSAGDLDKLADGQAAFNAGDYTLSFSLWSTLATEGNADAQVFVGLSYDNGWGIQQNPQLARVWYKKAAKNNNRSAQYLLGLHFIQGTNAERAKGLMWLQRAADNGDSAAQQFLKKGKKRGWFKGITPIAEPEEKEAPQTLALAR
jgi:TPR repeat protein